jgi:putative metallopeptidase DUF4344
MQDPVFSTRNGIRIHIIRRTVRAELSGSALSPRSPKHLKPKRRATRRAARRPNEAAQVWNRGALATLFPSGTGFPAVRREPVLAQPAPSEAQQYQARVNEAVRALTSHPSLKNVPEQKRQQFAAFVLGNVTFVLLHEMAHALVHELNLPVLGREEDAAVRAPVEVSPRPRTPSAASRGPLTAGSSRVASTDSGPDRAPGPVGWQYRNWSTARNSADTGPH